MPINRVRLTEAQARPASRQVVQSGWADWLIEELRTDAEQKFAAAGSTDIEALRDAKAAYELVVVVDSIIKNNANR